MSVGSGIVPYVQSCFANLNCIEKVACVTLHDGVDVNTLQCLWSTQDAMHAILLPGGRQQTGIKERCVAQCIAQVLGDASDCCGIVQVLIAPVGLYFDPSRIWH